MLISSSKLACPCPLTESSLPAANVADHGSGEVGSSGEFNAFAGPASSKLRAALAFTLVEMLVVMGIIILLIGVTVPTFKGLLGGRGVNAGINNVTGILELARATSLANRTYTYVCFKNVVNSDNTCELRCAAFQSRNGLGYYDSTVIRPITKLVKIPSVKNVAYSSMPLAIKNVTPKTAPQDLTNDGSYIASWYPTETASGFPSVVVDGEDFKGATYIQFTQEGGIGSSTDPNNLVVEARICLGLIATRGTTLQTNSNDGAIISVEGISGQMRIIRP